MQYDNRETASQSWKKKYIRRYLPFGIQISYACEMLYELCFKIASCHTKNTIPQCYFLGEWTFTFETSSILQKTFKCEDSLMQLLYRQICYKVKFLKFGNTIGMQVALSVSSWSNIIYHVINKLFSKYSEKLRTQLFRIMF